MTEPNLRRLNYGEMLAECHGYQPILAMLVQQGHVKVVPKPERVYYEFTEGPAFTAAKAEAKRYHEAITLSFRYAEAIPAFLHGGIDLTVEDRLQSIIDKLGWREAASLLGSVPDEANTYTVVVPMLGSDAWLRTKEAAAALMEPDKPHWSWTDTAKWPAL